MALKSTAKELLLLEKVRDLMFRHGIKSLTMDDIAQHLGISKKTLYQMVENKADLVHKVILLTVDESRKGTAVLADKQMNAIEENLHIFKGYVEMGKQVNPGLVSDLKKYYKDSYEVIVRNQGGFVLNSVRENIKRGMEEGLFRKDIDPEIIARINTSGELGAFNAEVFPPDKFSSAKVLKEMFFYHIRGIATEKGLKFLDTLEVEF